ncbi:serrate RNA effector molecule homolog [Aethina tumida]|uniref:serrate RNA effector molecule homolog n=1 Tax=Aethina tumida TaxID=116153 RepID=UPI00096B5896|nr:serrate RNA effector molecule homolog [Aethina tumida]
MADKVADEKPVESTVEEVEKVEKKAEEVPEEKEETKAENGDAKAENGDSEEKEEPKEKEAEKNGDEADSGDKCCIKRKSTSAADAKEAAAEGATPEKKAKLDETTEAEVVA